MAAIWRYGDLEVQVPRQRAHLERVANWAFFVLAFVIAPTVAAGWAIWHWFPLSLPIGLTITALAWVGVLATAVDEDELG
ncbi:MAG: hypothetical protein QOK28_1759 [Actinomycetota bacterium]